MKTRIQDRGTVLVPRRVIEDRNLSWSAIGLFAFVMGKPDGWQTSTEELAAEVSGTASPNTVAEISEILDELVGAGYLAVEE